MRISCMRWDEVFRVGRRKGDEVGLVLSFREGTKLAVAWRRTVRCDHMILSIVSRLCRNCDLGLRESVRDLLCLVFATVNMKTSLE